MGVCKDVIMLDLYCMVVLQKVMNGVCAVIRGFEDVVAHVNAMQLGDFRHLDSEVEDLFDLESKFDWHASVDEVLRSLIEPDNLATCQDKQAQLVSCAFMPGPRQGSAVLVNYAKCITCFGTVGFCLFLLLHAYVAPLTSACIFEFKKSDKCKHVNSNCPDWMAVL
jgi:hypothetical protein